MKNKPTIVVVAYNRVDSLSRLLQSLLVSNVETNTKLVISIDYSGDDSVESYANSFDWSHGEKVVITHEKNLGLRRHVLKCGDLTTKYGSIILLEDDLVVSPMFYQYTQNALDFYEDNCHVGGVSLYNHKYNVNSRLTFEPLVDGFDNYWLQFASSWGQAWTVKQWKEFRAWYDNDQIMLTEEDSIPTNVVNWPESSWLKYFIKYLVVKNKYFIYPRESLTTNFSDIGTHVTKKDFTFQVSLSLSKDHFNFSSIDESNSIYDVFFEIKPQILKKFNKALDNINFEVDLYGTKQLSTIKSEFLLSSKDLIGKPVMSFARELRPHDLNITSNFLINENAIFNLANSHYFTSKNSKQSKITENEYYFYSLSFNRLINILVERIKYKIKSMIQVKL